MIKLGSFVSKRHRPQGPLLVVTLPREGDHMAFALEACRQGADLLEVRNDLTPDADVQNLAEELPLLVAARTGEPLRETWLSSARLVDIDISRYDILSRAAGELMYSYHAEKPLSLDAAQGIWKKYAKKAFAIKHVEPHGKGGLQRMKQLREKLLKGCSHVTVLLMGEGSATGRRELAPDNYLHYCALSSENASAPGQPLLAGEVKRLRATEMEAEGRST